MSPVLQKTIRGACGAGKNPAQEKESTSATGPLFCYSADTDELSV